MTVFLNGQFVPEAQAVVSVFDRGFLYGDGLFETLPVFNGKPFRWAQHWARLQRGAEFLRITMPFASEVLRGFAEQLVVLNQAPFSLLRLTLSRGVGARGYSPKGADRPSLVISTHSQPEGDQQKPLRWRLVTSRFHLPANEPLAQFKTCNKLPQILARTEADAAGADEALLLSTDGYVVEGASSNLFWIDDNTVCTSPLASGVLPGVTRAVVLEICQTCGLAVREANVNPDRLRSAKGVFLSLSSRGIVEGLLLDGKALAQSTLVERLRVAYWGLVRAESG
jgi:aminodeoxychorismate lyase